MTLKNFSQKKFGTNFTSKLFSTAENILQLVEIRNEIISVSYTHLDVYKRQVYVRPNLEVPDIGFAFFEEYEGKGYAFESANFIKNLVKTDFGITKIGGITVEYNLSLIHI